MISTNFSNDDFFAEDFHGIVHPCGLLLYQDHFTKCPFPQQLQVVKITHGLLEQGSEMSRDKLEHNCWCKESDLILGFCYKH